MIYFVKKPEWVRKFYGDCLWEVNTRDKVLYLTFDDGPDPAATPFVLNQLKRFNAKATFFCIGSHVKKHPEIFSQILNNDHAVGNHTFSHFDGWKTSNRKFFNDISDASAIIPSRLFRPPFGHITWRQVKRLKGGDFNLKIILWSVLSADFDTNTTEEKCLHNVIKHAKEGSIILFHDSKTAERNLRYTLPRILEHYSEAGYRFEKLEA